MESSTKLMMPKKKESESLAKKYMTISVVVTTYWIISISFVFINKTLFNSKVINLNAPLFVTWTQCVTSALICFCWQLSSGVFPESLKFPKSQPFNWRTIKSILPVSILSVFTLSFGNLCLSFVDVSFYFISRSLTTVFNVILTYIILHQKVSIKTCVCCFVIVFGFSLGVNQENFLGSLSLKGTISGVLSSLSLSLYSIFTKKVLPLVNNEVILLSFYNNIYSTVLFIPLIFLNNEFYQLKQFNFFDTTFWMLTAIGGVFGFLIGFVTALQIKVTSPLTHNISGTAKACAQTVIASYWYKELKPVLWWISNFIVLFGSAAYARVKQLEMIKNNQLP